MESPGLGVPASIAPHMRAFSMVASRSQPMMRPANFFFLRARPREPPIRPVPMIVIWRMGIRNLRNENRRGRRGHRENDEELREPESPKFLRVLSVLCGFHFVLADGSSDCWGDHS